MTSKFSKDCKILSFEHVHDMWLRLKNNGWQTFHLYVDSPFCVKACKYCIYTAVVSHIGSAEYKKYYGETLPKEIDKFRDIMEKYHFRSVYFGGGTSSLMTEDVMRNTFDYIPGFKEIHFKLFEAHPAFINHKKIDILSEYGFTNISLGVQSFDEELIKSQNRIYVGPEKIKELVDYIKSKGILVNLDLLAFMESPTKEDLHKYMEKDLEIMNYVNPSLLDLYPVHNEHRHEYPVDVIYEYRKIINKFLMKHPNWRALTDVSLGRKEIEELTIANYRICTVSNEELSKGSDYSSSGGAYRPNHQNVLALGCSEVRETYSYFGLNYMYLNCMENGEIVYRKE